MTPLDPTERTTVLLSDLQQWQVALRWAHGLSAALDLADSYRVGRETPKTSRLTNLIIRSHDRLEGYLTNGVQTDELLSSESTD